MIKPGLPKGTRDFPPDVALKRNYIFDTIKKVYEIHGFLPIETPAMENIETLTGKYGEEGDRLIFKILNSGDFLQGIEYELPNLNSSALSRKIAEKALRYDLTVPFARFVVQNRNALAFPFKRYQIQPVWRADRPQKGRYREFYQCDADIIGSNSLLNEVELILIFYKVLKNLRIEDFIIKINNRKILSGLAEIMEITERFQAFLITLDKLDKIGKDKVVESLIEQDFDRNSIEKGFELIEYEGTFEQKVHKWQSGFASSEIGAKGCAELQQIFQKLQNVGFDLEKIEFDASLARGLDYYTGSIFEVKVNRVSIGSIAGGGRYDDLTGIFGMSGLSGVGISFGADRIYDVMEELNLFQNQKLKSVKVMFANFGIEEENYCMKLAEELRGEGISVEIYPEAAKIAKQFDYANKKGIEYVCLIGSKEIETGNLQLKNMKSGEQYTLKPEELLTNLK